MVQLSGERIRSELLLLLAAPRAVGGFALGVRHRPSSAPLMTIDGSVTEAVERLAAIERRLSRAPDPALRLAALAAGTSENLGERLYVELSGTREPSVSPPHCAARPRSTRAATRAPPRSTSTGTGPRHSPTQRCWIGRARQISLVVNATHISGVQPSTAHRLIGGLMLTRIARHHNWPAHEDLAGTIS